MPQTGTLNGTLQSIVSLRGIIVAGSTVDFPAWEGPYQIYPEVTAQEFETKDKCMTDDLDVAAIPYHEVSNEFGTTIIIGGISNAS